MSGRIGEEIMFRNAITAIYRKYSSLRFAYRFLQIGMVLFLSISWIPPSALAAECSTSSSGTKWFDPLAGITSYAFSLICPEVTNATVILSSTVALDIINQDTGQPMAGNPVTFTIPANEFTAIGMREKKACGGTKVDVETVGQTTGTVGNTTVNVVVTGEKCKTTGSDPNVATSDEPVNTYNGELFNQEKPDLSLGGPMPLYFARYYDSFLRRNYILSDLGNNWRHNFSHAVEVGNWDIYYINAAGRRTHFAAGVTPGTWEQQDNKEITYSLSQTANGSVVVFDPQAHRIFSFLTSYAGQLGTLKLSRVEDGRGNVHTLSYDAITGQLLSISDGLGRTLTFTYGTATPKITQVTDGTRTISFAYADPLDPENLTSFTDTAGGVTTYAYMDTTGTADHGLMTSKKLPRLNIPFSQTYTTAIGNFDNGWVATQSDAAGNTTTFSHVTDVNFFTVTTMTEPNGNTRIHTSDQKGNFMKNGDQAGNTFFMNSDINGRRTGLIDRLGDTTNWSYDPASGNLASQTNADGTASGYTYAPRTFNGVTLYDLTDVTHADGTTESFVYDAAGNLTSHTDQLGNAATFTWNANGRMLTSTNRLGGVTTNTYNAADGTLAGSTDPAGNAATFGYDLLKRPNKLTHADASFVAGTYDNLDHPLTATDENGNTTTFTYDANGNLASVKDALNNTTAFAYDGNDRLLSVTDPLGGVSSRTYDALGRVATVTDANGNTTTSGYDVTGRLASITDPLTNIWGRTYDLEGVLASSTDPLGNTATFISDKMGRIAQVNSPLGNISSVTYDAMGRVATATDPLGNVTTLTRDAKGQLGSVSLPGAISTSYARNKLGQITQTTDPNGNNWVRAFDTGGRQNSSTDPLGNLRTLSYDNRNRPSVVTYPGGLGTLTMGYDSAGNLTSRTYSDGTTIIYSYDAKNHLTAANGIANTFDANGRVTSTNGIGVAYDAGGRITTLTLATGKSVTYAYDGNDRLTSVTDWAGGATTFSYDAAGRLTGITRPNGINRTNTYDNDSLLTSFTEGTIASASLTRDANGRITAATRTRPKAATATALASSAHTFNAASEMGGVTYDALGRPTAAGADTFSWDLASRLTSYTRGGATVSATYDAGGFRLSRTTAVGTRNYVWNYGLDITSISIEKQGAAALNYYIHTPGGALLYRMDATTNARQFYHYDEMGNTLFVSNDAGATVALYSYSPFGQLIGSTGALDNPFTWQGQHGIMDEGNNLYYIRARYYDADAGRFVSRDALKGKGPKSVNPYQYAFSNPLVLVDVTGASPITSVDFTTTIFLIRKYGFADVFYSPTNVMRQQNFGRAWDRCQKLDIRRKYWAGRLEQKQRRIHKKIHKNLRRSTSSEEQYRLNAKIIGDTRLQQNLSKTATLLFGEDIIPEPFDPGREAITSCSSWREAIKKYGFGSNFFSKKLKEYRQKQDDEEFEEYRSNTRKTLMEIRFPSNESEIRALSKSKGDVDSVVDDLQGIVVLL